jgi:hypothetical protein
VDTTVEVAAVGGVVRHVPSVSKSDEVLESIVNSGVMEIHDIQILVMTPDMVDGAATEENTDPGCGITKWFSYGTSFDFDTYSVSAIDRVMQGTLEGYLTIEYSVPFEMTIRVPAGYHPVVMVIASPDNMLPNGYKYSDIRADSGTLTTNTTKSTPLTRATAGIGPVSWGMFGGRVVQDTPESTIEWAVHQDRPVDLMAIEANFSNLRNKAFTTAGAAYLRRGAGLPTYVPVSRLMEIPGGGPDMPRSGVTPLGKVESYLSYSRSVYPELESVSRRVTDSGLWSRLNALAMSLGIEVHDNLFEFVVSTSPAERADILRRLIND